jgi:hypothetical protein
MGHPHVTMGPSVLVIMERQKQPTTKLKNVKTVRRKHIGGFLKVSRVQNGKFVLVMSQGINFVVTSQRIFHFGRLDAY